jgi:hypothetical protein
VAMLQAILGRRVEFMAHPAHAPSKNKTGQACA